MDKTGYDDDSKGANWFVDDSEEAPILGSSKKQRSVSFGRHFITLKLISNMNQCYCEFP